MQVYLKVWRQQTKASRGHFADYSIADVSPDMSFLEMLDLLNDRLIREGERPIEFDHDCREGICGQCGVMINGRAHGPLPNTTTCQLHMRTFADGSTIYVEPFRADAFPIKCDLKVDRSAFDRIIQVGGYVSAALLPQGKIEARQRVVRMVAQMDREGFGHCSNTEACQVECPQEISVLHIARMNWEYNRALLS
jgi:succinate dehydrogenase / fumarate reductase iron-sulfur subunit